MKKIFAVLALAAFMILPVFAQEGTTPVWNHGDNISNITYQNVRIYKVYDQAEAYIVLYEKQGIKIGQCVIPKSWAKETPRKLQFRDKPPKMQSYMTVIQQDGQFLKVWLTVPNKRSDPTWAVAAKNVNVDATVETLEIEL